MPFFFAIRLHTQAKDVLDRAADCNRIRLNICPAQRKEKIMFYFTQIQYP